jgi:hypothetical protein
LPLLQRWAAMQSVAILTLAGCEGPAPHQPTFLIFILASTRSFTNTGGNLGTGTWGQSSVYSSSKSPRKLNQPRGFGQSEISFLMAFTFNPDA